MKSVLFISRKYPPIVGGMENYAYFLHKEFKKNNVVYDIILTKKQGHLIWFYPWIFLRGLFFVLFKKIDYVYVGDGVLCSVAWFFQNILGKKVILTIHGLDVIYKQSIYQKMVKVFLPKINTIVANSEATKSEAIKRGVSDSQIKVIPVGVDWPEIQKEVQWNKAGLGAILPLNLKTKKILFTIGRLVKRKGVHWFVRDVVPKLDDRFVYIIAGSGSESILIEAAITKYELSERVFLVGKVDDKTKEQLFSISHVFVSPNLSIKGDMEGFGIVNLEAGSYGVPVVAAAVDGVQDAVINGKTGYLVKEKDANAFVNGINDCLLLDKNQISQTIKERYSWASIYMNYELLLRE